jgi:hypothetical protein
MRSKPPPPHGRPTKTPRPAMEAKAHQPPTLCQHQQCGKAGAGVLLVVGVLAGVGVDGRGRLEVGSRNTGVCEVVPPAAVA